MKPFKFIIALILYITIFTTAGESFQQYLSTFKYETYNTTFYLQRDQRQEDMTRDIMDSGKRNNIGVFTVDYAVENGTSTFIIYGMEGTRPYIEENFGIKEGIYNSIFLGNSKVKFRPFEEIEDSSTLINYGLVGEEEDASAFKRELVNTYAGNFPRDDSPALGHEEMLLIYWAILCFVILFLTYYDIMQQKKESFLRVTFGESVTKVILRNILLDGVLLMTAFATAYAILHKITYTDFNLSTTIICFLVTLVLNSAMYLNLRDYKIKKVLALGSVDEKSLHMNYLIKTISTILVVVLISSNIVIIGAAVDFYKQKPFFESHKGYSYVVMQPHIRIAENEMIDANSARTRKVEIEFYKKYYKQCDATMLIEGYGKNDGLFANKNSFDYLVGEIPELEKYREFSEDFLVIVKEGKHKQEDIDLAVYMTHLKYQQDMTYRAVEYSSNAEIAYVDNIDFNGSGLLKNPAIVLFNERAIQDNIGQMGVHRNQEVMYNIEEDEFKSFVQSVHMEDENVFLRNAYEKYTEKWVMMKRAMVMSTVLTLLTLLFEFFIIRLVILQEYKARAVELSIKKVLGYSILQKNKKIFILTAVSFTLSVIASLIGGYFLNEGSVLSILTASAILFVCELIIMTGCIRKIEKVNVQKILKGGAL